MDASNLVFHIDLVLDHQIFLTSQRKGVITVFSLPDCQILSILNKFESKLPMSIDFEDVAIKDPSAQQEKT